MFGVKHSVRKKISRFWPITKITIVFVCLCVCVCVCVCRSHQCTERHVSQMLDKYKQTFVYYSLMNLDSLQNLVRGIIHTVHAQAMYNNLGTINAVKKRVLKKKHACMYIQPKLTTRFPVTVASLRVDDSPTGVLPPNVKAFSSANLVMVIPKTGGGMSPLRLGLFQ